jgi:hypothetical protein
MLKYNMLLKHAQITLELHIILNFLLLQLVSDTIFIWKTYILSYGCVALVRKAADEIRVTIFFQKFQIKVINELVLSS